MAVQTPCIRIAAPRGKPARRRPRLRGELALAALGLLLLGGLAYGSHVAHGGVYSDDYINEFTTIHPPRGFLGPIDMTLAGYRPVLALLLPIPHLLFGIDPVPNLALSVLLVVLASWSLVVLLRAAGVDRAPALAVGALALLFPWAPATRLWATGAINQLPLAMVLLGATVGLRALQRPGPRSRRRKWAAIVLFVLATLTYEAVAALALCAVLLYAREAGWRTALRQWRWEALAIVAALTFNAIGTTRANQTPGAALDHGIQIADQALTQAADALSPFAQPSRAGILALALALCGAALIWSRRRPAADPAGRIMRQGLGMVAGGVVGVVAGYAFFVPAGMSYMPLSPNVGGRANLIAPTGFAVFAAGLGYAVAGMGAAALARAPRHPAPRPAATALIVAIAAALGFGYAGPLTTIKRNWARASTTQTRLLGLIEGVGPELEPGTVLYLAGAPTQAGGAPVFGRSFDLNGAVKLKLANPSISAYPLHPRQRLKCGPRRAGPPATVDLRERRAPYGRVVVLDARTGILDTIVSAADCAEVNRTLATTEPTSDTAIAQRPL